MTHHSQDHDPDGPTDDERGPGPTHDSDPATQADVGLTGSPDESYSPDGMAEDEDNDH